LEDGKMKAKYLILAMLVIILGTVSLMADNKDIIKQGDFALLLVNHTATPAPQGGWTQDSALTLLQEIAVLPFSGNWSPGEDLTEGDLAHIMRQVGLSIFSVRPDEKVTWGRANAVFYRYDDFLKNFNLKTRTVYGTTTTHVDTAVGGSDSLAPASPTTP
jgi:hypothetical protein